MGGTTAKAGIVRDGRPGLVTDFQVGGKGSFGGTRAGTGFPVKITTVDLAEVGAGGGSIAWIDADGALRVGPRSAGAVPGPACYGRGGTEPTVTDADLVLGYLDPGGLAGGVVLSADAARDALARGVADPLGIEVTDAARAVHDIVNANMAAAIRVVTVQRGIDPRGLTLVAFGGAGPDARGPARRDVRHRLGRGAARRRRGVGGRAGGRRPARGGRPDPVVDLAGADPAELEAAFAELADQARAELADEPGTAFEITRAADVRYRGQAYHLTLPVPDPPMSADDVAALAASFRARFEEAYGIALDLPTQIHNLRVHVVRVVEKFAPARPPAHRRVRGCRSVGGRVGEREVVFPASGTAAVPTRSVRPDPARTWRPLRGARGDRRAGVDHRRPTAHARRGRRVRHRALDARA